MKQNKVTKVFISHGHKEILKLKLKNFIAEDLELRPIVLDKQPDKGLTVINKLEEYGKSCDFALIILTADDRISGGKARARQNVIHELGFFQGILGRDRVLLLRQSGVELFSNISGLICKEFKNNKIEETFEDIRKAIKGVQSISKQTILTEKIFRFPKAFPLKGRTRIIYTCRNYFEDSPFKCPGEYRSLKSSKTAPTHIPVDELETNGLCLAWYGPEILGDQEEHIKSAIYCSKSAAMDMVIRYCVNAKDHLSKRDQNRFNISSVPIPLYITLLRFSSDTTDRQRSEAKDWTSKNKRKIWGKSKNLQLVLSRAFKSPFCDVDKVVIR